MKNEKGITLIETLIVATLMLFIMGAAFSLMIHFGAAQRTQLAQTRLSEESRYMFNAFADQLKGAGAILTLAHTNSFLSDIPYFNGLFPLDKTDGPDGIIIASGDQNGVTTLTANFTPPTSPLTVKSTLKNDGTSAWAVGDKGIVVSKFGYYIFSVATGITATSLPIRDSAVYYSGLLNNCGTTYQYTDTLRAPATVKGNAITYSGTTSPSAPKTPVIRLTNFCIYLFDEVDDTRLKRKVNRMYGITDTKGDADKKILTDDTIVSDNISDMQLSYTFIPGFPALETPYEFFKTTTNPTLPPPNANETVYSLIQKQYLKEINVTIVVLTDEYGGKGTRELTIPAFKNRSGYTLPSGKYDFKIYSYLIQNKNFNIVL